MISMKLLLVISNLIFIATASSSKLISLDENNWELMLEGEWMVEFYAPWCPACRALEPVWNDFASWSDDLGITVGHVDVTTSPGLSGRFMVTALPTIYHVKDGVFRQYRGARDKNEFTTFVEEKKWEQIEPIPNWKSPSSIQMSVVSGFFKLSMLLRNIHTHITEDYGIPYWGSYLLFALATIIIGAILGLVLVFLIDCVYPNKALSKKSDSQLLVQNDTQDKDDEEIVDEEGDESERIEDEDDSGEMEKEESETVENEEEAKNGSEAPSSSPDVRRRQRSRKAD